MRQVDPAPIPGPVPDGAEQSGADPDQARAGPAPGGNDRLGGALLRAETDDRSVLVVYGDVEPAGAGIDDDGADAPLAVGEEGV